MIAFLCVSGNALHLSRMIFERLIAGFVALAGAIFAIILDPGNFIAIGVMDASLTSDNEMVRRVAEAEIAAARVSLAAGAAVLAAGALFWPRLARSHVFRRLSAGSLDISAEYAAFLRRLITPGALILFGAVLLMLAYIRVGAALFSHSVLWLINGEDGVLETASAVMVLLAAGLSASIAYRVGRGHRRFACHVVLAVLFFFMFGEEISWGQRLFGFATPEIVATVNVQNEVNLHNMFGYLFDHLFILGFLSWAIAVPLLYHALVPFRKLFVYVGLPVPSAGLAVAMACVGLMLDPIVFRFLDPLPTLRLAEAREALSTLAFLLLVREVSQHFPAGKPAPAG